MPEGFAQLPVYQPADQTPVYPQPVIQQPVYPQPAAVQPQYEQQPVTPQYVPQQPAIPQAQYAPQLFQPPAPQPGSAGTPSAPRGCSPDPPKPPVC